MKVGALQSGLGCLIGFAKALRAQTQFDPLVG